MDAAEYVVPAVLRDAMFVPGQAAVRCPRFSGQGIQ